MRVSTFVRKGEVITPTTHDHLTVLPVATTTSSVGPHPPYHHYSGITHDPCSPSETSTTGHPAINQALMNPKVAQMIQTLDNHLDNNSGSSTQEHDDSMTRPTNQPMQVLDNLKALEVIPKLTPEILGKIEHILGNTPKPVVCFPLCAPLNTQFYIPFIFHSTLTQGRAWINLPNSSVQDKWT